MISKIKKAWLAELKGMNASAWFRKIEAVEIEVCHYKGYLLETYHHAGLNPQIQAFATMYLKNNPRDLIKTFYRHAISEIGHDVLAMNDLKSLGVEEKLILESTPLPTTLALNAYVIYQIQFISPLCYLGYLFHLEFLPTQEGHSYMKVLEKMGISKSAMSFIEEHATVDVAHNKLMEGYIKELVLNDSDLELVCRAAVGSCRLHYQMISAAFDNGENLFRER